MKSDRSISGELSHKIIIAIAIIVLGAVLGIILFSGKVFTEMANISAQSTHKILTDRIENMLVAVETTTADLDWLVEDHLNDTSYFKVITDNVVKNNEVIAGAAISLSNRLPEGSTGGFWSKPFMSGKEGAGMVSTYYHPLIDASGKQYGVFSVDVTLSAVKAVLDSADFYTKAYAVVLDRNGDFISHPDWSLVERGINMLNYAESIGDAKLVENLKFALDGGSGIGEIAAIREGDERSALIYGPISNGWSLAIISPWSAIVGGVFRFQILLLIIALLDLVVLYLVTHTIVKRTLLPITEFTYTALNVAKGNFKAKIPEVKSENEIKHLRDALVFMLHSIDDYMAQLKTTTAENERFESELAIASNIQKQMLRTDFINNGEVDLFATLKPAKEVGGDMYDFLLSDRTLYFAVGDVSGKGVPAALYMAISRSMFHYVSGQELGSSGVVSCINDTFCSGNESNMFITLFVGRLNLDTGELLFCNAGHNPIIVISPEGKAEYLHAKSNLAAGVFCEFPYEKEMIHVRKGSRLLIYTDGISEAENVFKDQYGEDRLLEFAESQSTELSSEEFINNLIASVKAFTKENEQNDDITVMSVKF